MASVLQQIVVLYFYTHHEFGSNFVVNIDLIVGNIFYDQMLPCHCIWSGVTSTWHLELFRTMINLVFWSHVL